MKVLMINSVCGIRSTGRICADLAEALEEQGHEVRIAYGREKVPDQYQKYAVRIGSDFDVKLHAVRARLFDSSGFGSKRSTEKFIEWIRSWDPDVIHLHNVHGYYLNIETLFDYLRICGKKIIWTFHDCWPFTGHSAYCDAIRCEKWKTGCNHCPQKKEYPRAFFDHSKHNWIKKKQLFTGINNLQIITPSYWLSNLVKESFMSEYPVTVIHNGIDTKQFRPLCNDFKHEYGLEGKFLILGVASTWNDMKGYSDFLKLSKMLDDHYRIVLVGVSNEQIQELPKNIIGIKQTNSIKELAQIYSACDLFVNLTYCDVFGMVNREAIACGTPVITYKTGGSPESATKKYSVVVEQGDLQTLISLIRQIKEGIISFPDFNESDISFADKEIYIKNYCSLVSSANGDNSV